MAKRRCRRARRLRIYRAQARADWCAGRARRAGAEPLPRARVVFVPPQKGAKILKCAAPNRRPRSGENPRGLGLRAPCSFSPQVQRRRIQASPNPPTPAEAHGSRRPLSVFLLNYLFAPLPPKVLFLRGGWARAWLILETKMKWFPLKFSR